MSCNVAESITGEADHKVNSDGYCKAVTEMLVVSEFFLVFIGIFFSLANSKGGDKLQEDSEDSSKS